MKEFNFGTTKLKINIEGESYELRFPNVEESDWFDNQVSKIMSGDKELSMTDVGREYFKKIGLPKKAYNKLESWQIQELLKHFQDPKKN